MGVRSPGIGSGGRGAVSGTPGRGVKSAAVSTSGHLFVTYTDDSIQDAGAVQGTTVTVGQGPPSSATALAGDLYIDAQTGDIYRMGA